MEEKDNPKIIDVTNQQLEEKKLEIKEINFILRPKIHKIFPKTWILVVILYIIFFTIRGIGALGTENLRILILVGFILMWPLPFIFYTKFGRVTMGIKKIEKPWWFLWGVILGVGAAALIYLIGWAIFGNTNEHWYSAILNQVISEEDRTGMSLTLLFFIITGPAIIFSPVGEELFFRGMIHEAFKKPTAKWTSWMVNCFAFALIHIFHYGIAYQHSTGLEIHPWTGLLWFFLMAGVSALFTLTREKSKSIFPSIVSHAAFNLTMNGFILLIIVKG